MSGQAKDQQRAAPGPGGGAIAPALGGGSGAARFAGEPGKNIGTTP